MKGLYCLNLGDYRFEYSGNLSLDGARRGGLPLCEVFDCIGFEYLSIIIMSV